VRRTDKVGTEAQFHDIREYMTHVLDYFDEHHPPEVKRRVYLATDEPKVIDEARRLCVSTARGGRLAVSSNQCETYTCFGPSGSQVSRRRVLCGRAKRPARTRHVEPVHRRLAARHLG